MPVTYTRTLKSSHANEWDSIIAIGNQVRRVLAGIVHEDPDNEEYQDEVKIQMQPGENNTLVIIGWIGRDPIDGMPDEQFDEEVEILPDRQPRPITPEIPESTVSPFSRRG